MAEQPGDVGEGEWLCSAAARAEPASCPQIDFTSELPPIASDPKLTLSADNADLTEGGLSSLSGSVRVSQNGREFAAEQVNYSEAEQRIRTDSQTLFRDQNYAIRSGKTDYDLNLGSGVFLDNSFTLRTISGRGEAGRIAVAEDGKRTPIQKVDGEWQRGQQRPPWRRAVPCSSRNQRERRGPEGRRRERGGPSESSGRLRLP